MAAWSLRLSHVAVSGLIAFVSFCLASFSTLTDLVMLLPYKITMLVYRTVGNGYPAKTCHSQQPQLRGVRQKLEYLLSHAVFHLLGVISAVWSRGVG